MRVVRACVCVLHNPAPRLQREVSQADLAIVLKSGLLFALIPSIALLPAPLLMSWMLHVGHSGVAYASH